MTLEEANIIWEACYGSNLASETAEGWAKYTSWQRLEAIDVRQLEHERINGGWGEWYISDRH